MENGVNTVVSLDFKENAVHETSSSPFAQFDLILGWTTWKWLWATWNYNEMLKQPICERIGHGWRFHALKTYADMGSTRETGV